MLLAFDSSALLKRYIHEEGRERVFEWLQKASRVSFAAHTKTEVAGALVRAKLDGRLDEVTWARLMNDVHSDFAAADIVPLSSSVESRAIHCMGIVRLRAMDALHVASAIEVQADRFITADVRQFQAAQAAGLQSELIQV